MWAFIVSWIVTVVVIAVLQTEQNGRGFFLLFFFIKEKIIKLTINSNIARII